MLADSAYIQEREAEYINTKKLKKGEPQVEPLYTLADAQKAMKQFYGVGYERTFVVEEGIANCFYDAGHILGSALSHIIVYEKEFVSKSFLSNLSFINKGLLLVRNVYGKSHVLNFTENKAYAVQQDFSVDSTGYLLKSINATHILSMNLDKDKRTYKSFNLENRNSQTLLKKKIF